ncbi:hypothetical protein [uncultured Rhodospira sp.]|uniref:GFA family protein n=1 Tax=uncultured Rhodospira sp. TaxID=1936189 RepID=UPI002606764C|nr:hypothetical protein [uncultured Rhodospira sp.]
MSDPSAPARTGGCLCGAARFSLAEETTAFSACHCAMDRRWSGGDGGAATDPA